MPENTKKSVVIVGGGLAGISAAISLQKQGHEVRILESRRRLGGRAGSFEDSLSGKNLDYCQHVGMLCCTSLVWLLRNLEIDTFWKRQNVLHVYSNDGKHLPVEASFLPAPLHLSGLLNRWPGLTVSDRMNIGWGLWKLMRLRPTRDLDDSLAIDWLRKIGQRPQVIDRFWATILVSALGDQVDRVTLGATRKVLVDGFASNRDAYNLMVPQESLSELLGERGAVALAKRGIQIDYGTTIQDCQWNDNRCQALVAKDGTIYRGDHFIFAVPWHQLPKIIESHCDISLLKNIHSSPITGIHTWWDKNWMETPHAILVDRLCQWVFKDPIASHANALAPLEERQSGAIVNFENDRSDRGRESYFQIVISGSRDLPKGDTPRILELVRKDLAEIFPAAASSKLLRGRVITDPQSVFSMMPGHQNSRLSADHFAKQNIWLSGDWTDTKWPATMEGAVRSGLTASNCIAQLYGQPTLENIDLKKGWLANWLIA